MSNKKADLSRDLKMFFVDRRGKYYLCPDAIPRRLIDIELKDDRTTLSFSPAQMGDQPMEYKWDNKDVETHFKQFRSVSQQQAQGKTQLPAVSNDDALTPTVIEITPIQQAMAALDPNGMLNKVADGLMAAFDKVQSTPTYIEQAKAQNEIGKSVIDLFKTKVMAVKVLGDLTKKNDRHNA